MSARPSPLTSAIVGDELRFQPPNVCDHTGAGAAAAAGPATASAGSNEPTSTVNTAMTRFLTWTSRPAGRSWRLRLAEGLSARLRIQ